MTEQINQLAVCDKQEGNQSREGGKKNSVAAVSLNPTWHPFKIYFARQGKEGQTFL